MFHWIHKSVLAVALFGSLGASAAMAGKPYQGVSPVQQAPVQQAPAWQGYPAYGYGYAASNRAYNTVNIYNYGHGNRFDVGISNRLSNGYVSGYYPYYFAR
jgi:hypothetical protein